MTMPLPGGPDAAGAAPAEVPATATAPATAEDDELPPGYVLVTVRTVSVEMRANTVPVAPAVPAGRRVTRWRRPPLDAYRRLFAAVGGPWGWTGRLIMPDDELRATLDDPRVEVWRLWHGSSVAGFVELDRREPGETEIIYFGLVPNQIGRGIGSLLLRWAIHHTWTTVAGWGGAGRPGTAATAAALPAAAEPTHRLWLHTCDRDHPGALAVYLKAGFEVFEDYTGPEAYPADFVSAPGLPGLATAEARER
jgi:GNAT superfamily N-acetyltransferase